MAAANRNERPCREPGLTKGSWRDRIPMELEETSSKKDVHGSSRVAHACDPALKRQRQEDSKSKNTYARRVRGKACPVHKIHQVRREARASPGWFRGADL